MKKTILPVLLFVSAALLIGFSTGPAGGLNNNGSPRMQDRSGSPFANSQGPTCATCHNGGGFSPSLNIQLLDQGTGVEISKYVPEQTYDLKYTLTATNGNPAKYGMQSVILSNADNANAGSFGAAPTSTRVANIDDRQYFEHSTPNDTSVFMISWTAPESGTGNLTIYAAGTTANGTGNTSGDSGVATSLELSELSSSISNLSNIGDIAIYPNPATEQASVYISTEAASTYTMTILSIDGKIEYSDSGHLVAGNTALAIPANQLQKGIHIVQLRHNTKIINKRLMIN